MDRAETELPRATGDTPGAVAADDVPASATVDRYRITRRLGAGGMGVVYAAHDPELDREIALKLLRAPWRADGATEDRMRREAQAMARLSHPNVVPVFDIGTFGDRPFIAMELCAGGTLRSWLRTPRPWREVVRRFIAAGRGLAAAHAAGFAHCDFKPDNVLLTGGGDVRVSDFGVVRALDAPDGAEEVIAGTISYMAPEQLLGREVGAAADQFGFFVSLFEGLHGQLPFAPPPDVPRAVGLLSEISAGRVRTKPDPAVPRWLRAVVLRGLAADPALRWASMDAAVAALERGLGRTRRHAAGALALAAVGALAAAGIVLVRDDAGRACAAPERRLAGVWTSSDRQALATRFDRLGAGGAFTLVADELDRYGSRFTDAWASACEAHHITRTQDREVLALRDGCLARRLAGLAALVNALHTATEAEARTLVKASAGLAPPEACGDVERLREAPSLPDDAALRERLAALEVELDGIHALGQLGRNEAARDRARATLDEARAIGHPPAVGMALLRLGTLEVRLGDHDDGERHLFEASNAAESARAHGVSAEARLTLGTLSGKRGQHDAGLRWLEMAAAAAHAAGRADLQAKAFSYRGDLLFKRGDVDAALAVQRQAVAAAERADEDTLLTVRRNLSAALGGVGRTDEAKRVMGALCERLRARRSADHPDVIDCEMIEVATAQARGDVAEARRRMEGALAAYRRVYGTRSSEVALAEANLAGVLIDAGEPAAAQEHAQRAFDIYRELQGPVGDRTLLAVQMLSGAMVRQKKRAEARALLETTIADAIPALGEGHPRIATLRVNLGGLLLELDDCPAAVAVLEAALARVPAEGGHWVPTARWNLGRCQGSLGHLDTAIATLALARDEALAARQVVLAAQARYTRARVLWTRGDRKTARAEARASLDEMPEEATQLRAIIEAWLASVEAGASR